MNRFPAVEPIRTGGMTSPCWQRLHRSPGFDGPCVCVFACRPRNAIPWSRETIQRQPTHAKSASDKQIQTMSNKPTMQFHRKLPGVTSSTEARAGTLLRQQRIQRHCSTNKNIACREIIRRLGTPELHHDRQTKEVLRHLVYAYGYRPKEWGWHFHGPVERRGTGWPQDRTPSRRTVL